MKQIFTQLPQEILTAKRYFPVGANKAPHMRDWGNPDKQLLYSAVKGLAGFDTCGHARDVDYLFLDFDHVLDDNGDFVNQDAEKWFNGIFSSFDNCYCERSISGHGLHIFAVPSPDKFPKVSNGQDGILYFDRSKDAKLEVFYKNAARYCLVTGDLFRCEPQAHIPKGEVVDKVFQAILAEIKTRQSVTEQSTKKLPVFTPMKDSDVAEYDSFRADIMIRDFIPLKDLSGTEWLSVMSALKKLGFTYEEVDFLNQGGEHYNERENKARWDSLKDTSFDIATLHGVAKRFGYSEKDARRQWYQLHPDLKPSDQKNNFDDEPVDDIKKWQLDNGEIQPELLQRLKADAERLQSVTDFAAAATDTSTLKFLGACQYYSCFAHVRDNFFAALKRRKEEVANKIREFNSLKRNEALHIKLKGDAARAEIAALEPSDRELALNDLNITDTKNKVNTYETAAKKAHKKYLDQKHLDELNAKYQAERDAYDREPPTTQGSVPDCPIDLTLPLGTYFDTDHGIRIVDFDKPPGNRGRPVIETCQNLVVPVCAFREVAKRGENPKSKDQYEIAIKTSKHWRRVIVDARTLQDPRKILELTDFGLHIVDARMAAKYFAKILALNERNGKLKVTKIYLQPGWQDKNFKFFAYPTGGDDYIVKNADFDYRGIFEPQGDKDAWLHMLRRVIYHDPKTYSHDKPENFSDKPNLIAATILGSSFGAPLVAPLGIRNPQMVLGFDSGNGKTAAAKFAVSFFGDPFELCPTCNATENFLEDLAVKLNDFPHAVDELQAAKRHVRDNMDELVYKFSGGTTRGRADIQGNAKPTFHYRGFRLFTGEQTIINNSSGQGAVSRIFEIRKPELFEDTFAIEIHNFTQNHFGHFGKSFTTEFIPNNLDRIKERFNYWREAFGVVSSCQLLSSHVSFLAYAFVGLEFGLEAVGFSKDEIVNIICGLVSQMDTLIEDAPNKLSAKNINRALPDLINFVEAHPKNFMQETTQTGNTPNDNSLLPAEGTETFGIKLLDGRIAFNPLSLRKILSDELNYPSASQIINGFADAGFFDEENAKGKKHMKRLPSWMNALRGKTSWYYMLKAPAELPDSISA